MPTGEGLDASLMDVIVPVIEELDARVFAVRESQMGLHTEMERLNAGWSVSE
jgi:hypothetical protein